MTPFDQWINYAKADGFRVVHKPLDEQSRKIFNTTVQGLYPKIIVAFHKIFSTTTTGEICHFFENVWKWLLCTQSFVWNCFHLEFRIHENEKIPIFRNIFWQTFRNFSQFWNILRVFGILNNHVFRNSSIASTFWNVW